VLALTGAVLALVGRASEVAALMAGLGVAALIGAIVASGRSAPSRYRPRRLTSRDGAVMAAAVAVPVFLGVCAATGFDGLAWDPAELPLQAPHLPLVPSLVLLGLAAPVLVRPAPVPADELVAAAA
jgi:energy-coupling factor transport system permease protein